jgi:hypothetical protein
MAQFKEFADYFREREVESVHNGIIAVRRRSGRNWMLIDEVSEIPDQRFGDQVLVRFEAQDFLDGHQEAVDILAMRPNLHSQVRLDQVFQRMNGGWETQSLTLKQGRGVPTLFGLEPPVAEFLSAFDGKRTLGEMIEQFCAATGAPPEKMQKDCLELVRRLIEHGFVRWD